MRPRMASASPALLKRPVSPTTSVAEPVGHAVQAGGLQPASSASSTIGRPVGRPAQDRPDRAQRRRARAVSRSPMWPPSQPNPPQEPSRATAGQASNIGCGENWESFRASPARSSNIAR